MDKDGSGEIDFHEFKHLFEKDLDIEIDYNSI